VLCTGYRGDADKVQELVNMKANLHSTDALGNSPLHLAAFNGHLKVIRSPRARASEGRVSQVVASAGAPAASCREPRSLELQLC
jgi:ankyrin repeat protein